MKQVDGLFPRGGYTVPKVEKNPSGTITTQKVPPGTPFGRKEEIQFLLEKLEGRQSKLAKSNESEIKSYLDELKQLRKAVEENKEDSKSRSKTNKGEGEVYSSSREIRQMKKKIKDLQSAGEDALLNLKTD